MLIIGKTTLEWQLKAKVYTEGIKVIPQLNWKSYALAHCAEKLQLLTFLSPLMPLGNTVLS